MNISQLQSIIDKNSNAIRFAEINVKSLKVLSCLSINNVIKGEIKQWRWVISRLAKEQRRLKCEIKGMIRDKRCKHKSLRSVTSYVQGGAHSTTYCTGCGVVISETTYSLPSEDHGVASCCLNAPQAI